MKYRWYDASEKLPGKGSCYKRLSDNVLVKLEDGTYIEAYIDLEKKCWYNADNSKRLKETVVSWCLAY